MHIRRLREPYGGVLFLIAGVLFLGGILNDPPWKGYSSQEHVAFVGESLHVARSLLREGDFASPFGTTPTGPTAHVAPGYPFLQFELVRAFGEDAAGWLAIRSVPILALSLQYALLPYLARLLGFSVWTGVSAALFGLLMQPDKTELWEAHFAGLLILLLTAAMVLWNRNGGTLKTAAWLGFAAGLVFLIQPVVAAVYFVWVGLTERPLLTARFLVLTVVPLAVCAPWIIRTQLMLGGPTWIRDNLGIELSVSYNECAPYGLKESQELGCYTAIHPNTNPREAEVVGAMGEYRYNQDRMRIALGWIEGNPGRALGLAGQRFWYFWFPSDRGWHGYLEQGKRSRMLHVMTIASFIGLWLWWRQRRPSAALLALWLSVFPLIYYVVQSIPRYRYPILWVTWLLAAYAAMAAWTKVAGLVRARLGR